MGNSCQTPEHEDAGRFAAETNYLRKAKLALCIASDYEGWKYLRRAIKWYNVYQRCMACYVFLQFEDDFRKGLRSGVYDAEELDGMRRDELINHAQQAMNMYDYRWQLVEKYRKINEFQDPPALERPSGLTHPQWAMWMELVRRVPLSCRGDDEYEDDIEDMLERMGLLKKQSRKTMIHIMHKQAKEEAAAANKTVKQSTKVDFKPNITISPNMAGATANPTVAQSGSGPVTAGGASATANHVRTSGMAGASGGSTGDVPMMQPIQTPNGLLYPVMTPQGLMYVPMAGSSHGAPPAPAAASGAYFGCAPSAPPLAPRTPAPYAHVWA